jgi:hypothetical protein
MSQAHTSGLRSSEGSAHSRFRLAPTALVRRWPRHTPADRTGLVKVEHAPDCCSKACCQVMVNLQAFSCLGPGCSAQPRIRVQDAHDTMLGLRWRPMEGQGIVSSAASCLTLGGHHCSGTGTGSPSGLAQGTISLALGCFQGLASAHHRGWRRARRRTPPCAAPPSTARHAGPAACPGSPGAR